MASIRQALFLMTAQRYVLLAINFITLVTLPRLLSPEEIGLSVVGTAIAVLALGLRDFATGNFLIREKELSQEKIRGAFTVMLIVTSLISGLLLAGSPIIASAYNEPKLALYLCVIAAAIMLELGPLPLLALFQREMDFRKVAIVNLVNAAANMLASISFAFLGFSYMSVAWGWFFAALAGLIAAFYLRPDWCIFRPIFGHWRDMLVFGGYNGFSVFLNRIYEQAPGLLLGRVISFDAVGIYNRTLTICQLPDKLLLSGVMAIAMPAFAAQRRNGEDMKRSYLRAISYITAVQWPALLLLSILAYPVVQVLLGTNWLAAAPIVHILALASLLGFMADLSYALLVALTAMRDALLRGLIIWPLSMVVLCGAAFFGLEAMAASLFFINLFQTCVSAYFIRRNIDMSWREFWAAFGKSAIVSVCTVAGAFIIVAAAGFRFDLSPLLMVVAILLGGIGWCAGLWLTAHPLGKEIAQALDAFLRTAAGQRVVNFASRLFPRAARASMEQSPTE